MVRGSFGQLLCECLKVLKLKSGVLGCGCDAMLAVSTKSALVYFAAIAVRILSAISSGMNGFEMKSVAPNLIASSATDARALNTMTGRWQLLFLSPARNLWSTPKPSIPGMKMSRIITSGFSEATICRPSSPFEATSTSKPWDDRLSRTNLVIRGSSSTTRIRGLDLVSCVVVSTRLYQTPWGCSWR